MLDALDGFVIHHVPITAWGLLSSMLKNFFFFLLKPHHCSAAKHLFAVAMSAFTLKLLEAGDN